MLYTSRMFLMVRVRAGTSNIVAKIINILFRFGIILSNRRKGEIFV